ncbi:MAG: hypothetical protein HZB42_11315 [Sphingobacteriales bacterium]|nr:hypothetical protein [Sphingobacteriales bacterium]
MLRLKIIPGIISLGAAVLVLLGCYKDKTVILDSVDEITRPVTFSNDILPIFNNSCNTSGCHSAGGKAPDLTAANAYNSLTGGNYIKTDDPKNSELYLWMSGKKGSPMPLSGVNKDYNALILAWIKQGASNN